MRFGKQMMILAWMLSSLVLLLGASFFYSRSFSRGLFLAPVTRLEGAGKVVALTFDDGPSSELTPRLLDLLDRHGVKATFFMLGEQIEIHPHIARAVLERGHLIGNHSFDHPRMVFKTPGFVRDQIARTDLLIARAGQKDTRFFRPPYGAKWIVLPLVLRSMGKTMITGTYAPPAEFERPYDAARVSEQVLANVRPGAIVILHDDPRDIAEAFLAAVERVIVGLKAQGYTFIRLDGARAEPVTSADSSGPAHSYKPRWC